MTLQAHVVHVRLAGADRTVGGIPECLEELRLINFAKTSWLASICADRAYVVGRLRALLDGVTATIA